MRYTRIFHHPFFASQKLFQIAKRKVLFNGLKAFVFLWSFSLFSSDLEERISALETQMNEVGEKNLSGAFGSRFASETFKKRWVGGFFSGSALYWHTKVGESEVAYSWVYSAIVGSDLEKKEIESPHFNWGLGYRLGAGLALNFLDWELAGIYTHYSSRGNFKKFFKNDVSYDSADIELRGSSFLSRFFGIQTFLGGRSVWIDQNQFSYHSSLNLREKCQFHGVGPRFGGRLKWNLLYGTSFLANVSGSILYGDFEVRHFDEAMNLKRETKLFSTNLGFLLGIGWDVYTRGYHLGFSLGYEAEYYWRQNRMMDLIGLYRLQAASKADDLTFYGLTFKGVFEF